jgi:hypothetical protein
MDAGPRPAASRGQHSGSAPRKPEAAQPNVTHQAFGGGGSGERRRPTGGASEAERRSWTAAAMTMTAGSLRMATAAAHMARHATWAARSFPSQSLSGLGIDPSTAEAGICVIAAVAAYTLATPLMANSRAMNMQSRRRLAREAMAPELPCCSRVGKHKSVRVRACLLAHFQREIMHTSI